MTTSRRLRLEQLADASTGSTDARLRAAIALVRRELTGLRRDIANAQRHATSAAEAPARLRRT